METRGVEPLSKHIDTQASTFIVLWFRFRYPLAIRQASWFASLMISFNSCRRKELTYPTSFRTRDRAHGRCRTDLHLGSFYAAKAKVFSCLFAVIFNCNVDDAAVTCRTQPKLNLCLSNPERPRIVREMVLVSLQTSEERFPHYSYIVPYQETKHKFAPW